MDYQIDAFRLANDLQEKHRKEVAVIVANKHPEHFINLMKSLLTMDSGCNLTIVRVEGDRPDFSFSKAMNAGLKIVTSPYVLFLNDDTEFPQPLWLAALVDKLERFDLPLINPVQVDFKESDDKVYHRRLWSDLESDPVRYACSSNVFGPKFVVGFCMLGRREDFLSVGGWDEGFSYHFEDIDLSLRMEGLRSKRHGIDLTTWIRHGGAISTKKAKANPDEWPILKQKIDASKAHFEAKWGEEMTQRLCINLPSGTFDLNLLTPMNPKLRALSELDCIERVG